MDGLFALGAAGVASFGLLCAWALCKAAAIQPPRDELQETWTWPSRNGHERPGHLPAETFRRFVGEETP